MLAVTYNGNTAYYDLNRSYNNSSLKRGTSAVVYKTPLKYVWMPVNYIIYLPIDGVKSVVSSYPRGTIRKTQNFFIRMFDGDLFESYQYYQGYLVFNTPKYLPGDTVKLKSFIVDKKGKAVNKILDVKLQGNDGKVFTLTSLEPYRKGAYEYQFFLHDSLNLKPDKYYMLSLSDKRQRGFITNSFKYEDYELSAIHLDVRTKAETQYHGSGFSIFLKGTDENNLNLMDARVQIYAKPRKTEKYFNECVFIPDTLFYIEKDLKPRGETEVEIPDVDFPQANFSYEINFRLLTSDNQTYTINKTIDYIYLKKGFEISLINDSLLFVYKENEAEISKAVEISAMDNFNNKTVILRTTTPCKVKLNPYYQQYIAKSDNVEDSFNISTQPSLIQCFSQRTADSLFIEVSNPRNLHFTYNIYRKNAEKERGSGDSLFIRNQAKSKENYFISLRYLWGGKTKEDTYRIPFYDKRLNIAVEQPSVVYPGQTVEMEIRVTDQAGIPVENVDLTAYSFTQKFGSETSSVPYLGKEYKNKNIINNFRIKNNNTYSTSLQLDYEYWRELAELDSIEYYKFLYPENKIYRYAYTPNDSISQFAPFVISEKGDIRPVHIIYVDSRPVYFSWSTNRRPYSFHINPGYHQLKLRLNNKTITVDSIYFPENKKLILSLQENIQHANVRIQKAKEELSAHEKKQFIPVYFPLQI